MIKCNNVKKTYFLEIKLTDKKNVSREKLYREIFTSTKKEILEQYSKMFNEDKVNRISNIITIKFFNHFYNPIEINKYGNITLRSVIVEGSDLAGNTEYGYGPYAVYYGVRDE